jgi:hypothetical protein
MNKTSKISDSTPNDQDSTYKNREFLMGLTKTTIRPMSITWEDSLPSIYYRPYLGYHAFRADGNTCWLEEILDVEQSYVYAPAHIVDKWNISAWTKGEEFVWLADEEFLKKTEPSPTKPKLVIKSRSKQALYLLNSSLQWNESIYGFDFPDWVVTHVGIKELVSVALQQTPIDVAQYDVYNYAMASKVLHIPIKVWYLPYLSMEPECIVGYGDSRSKFGSGIIDPFTEWISKGNEAVSEWPQIDSIMTYLKKHSILSVILAWDEYFRV